MSEKITREWLDERFPHKVEFNASREPTNEYWDAGLRHDNGIGILRLRVIEFGDDEFAVEIAQGVTGASVEWPGGICVLVDDVESLMLLVNAVLHRNKVQGGV